MGAATSTVVVSGGIMIDMSHFSLTRNDESLREIERVIGDTLATIPQNDTIDIVINGQTYTAYVLMNSSLLVTRGEEYISSKKQN